MLVVTTSKENCESVWVANEWKRYLSLINNGSEKYIISCVKGITPKELPSELQNIQGIDMSKILARYHITSIDEMTVYNWMRAIKALEKTS